MEQDAEAPDVGGDGRGARLVAPHLRRHVGRGPARAGVRREVQACGVAEVGDDGLLAGTVDEHVAGLEVAVEDAERVGPVDRLRDRCGDLGDALRGARGGRVERSAVHNRHREVRDAIDLAGLVDAHEVGVIERRHGPRLAKEPVGLGEVGGEHLDGHGAGQGLVERLVDDAGRAGAEVPANPVAAPEEGPGEGRRFERRDRHLKEPGHGLDRRREGVPRIGAHRGPLGERLAHS